MGTTRKPERNFRTQVGDDLKYGPSKLEKTPLAEEDQNASPSQSGISTPMPPHLIAPHMCSHSNPWRHDGITKMAAALRLLGSQNASPKRKKRVRLSAIKAKTQIQNANPERNTKCPNRNRTGLKAK
jgi:hypothetical protein